MNKIVLNDKSVDLYPIGTPQPSLFPNCWLVLAANVKGKNSNEYRIDVRQLPQGTASEFQKAMSHIGAIYSYYGVYNDIDGNKTFQSFIDQLPDAEHNGKKILA